MKLFCQIFRKTASALLEKPLHQKSRSRSRFCWSRSPAKQTLILLLCLASSGPTTSSPQALPHPSPTAPGLPWLADKRSGGGRPPPTLAAAAAQLYWPVPRRLPEDESYVPCYFAFVLRRLVRPSSSPVSSQPGWGQSLLTFVADPQPSLPRCTRRVLCIAC